MRFIPPKSAPKKPKPTVLTDDTVKTMFAGFRIILKDGVVPVEGHVIGWKYTDAGPLGAIVRNPLNDNSYLYGIDFETGKPRRLAGPKAGSI